MQVPQETQPNAAFRRSAWIPRWFPALGLSLLVWGCKDLSVASSNLDALLDSDDHLRHVAKVRSGWRYYLDSILDPRMFGGDSPLWQSKEVKVADPAYTALENLLVLEKGQGARPATRDVIQVRQCSRYALRSPGRLVRERAVLELGPHARRLGLKDLSEVLTQPPLESSASNGAELSALLAGILETFEAMLRQGDDATPTTRGDFALACAQVDTSRLEMDGVWRLLKVVETFGSRIDLERDFMAPLLDLSERLQRRAVLLALAGTTVDRDDMVRAANLRTQYEAFGDGVTAEALLRLRGPLEQDPDTRFGLQAALLQEDATLRELFGLLAEHGWPQDTVLIPGEIRENRFASLRTILSVVNESARFDSRTRTSAMQALMTLVPDGPRSIREDAWVAWWQTWSPLEVERLKEMAAQAGASTAP
ncbi:MAG: hypothetical protein H6830_04305 [Planctomycetes bacterium]|nr:hypothetical protein [Planctomycetota bacterium]MCB9910460.1 hypothetical protein [Planctomycetota bacterium]MCB9912586.1 hypothetical protein [Planctomycetota bacterium]HPF15088.1 hypothetical protein [Planctomycetota bacterium]